LSKTGFTLIETMLAAALALFLTCGIAELCALSLKAQNKTAVVSSMTQTLLSRLESFKAVQFDSKDLGPGVHEETAISSDGKRTFLINYAIEEMQPGLKKINLAITPAGRPESTTRFVLYLSIKLETRQ